MKHVLVVDDDSTVLGLVTRALTGYAVVQARDGFEAMAAAATTHFDLVITDFMMPEMSGDELLGHLRERDSNLQVLMLTAHADILDGENLPWWRTTPHLAKPFSVETLRAAVVALVGEP